MSAALGGGSDRLWRETRGEGRHVILVHGTMDRSTSFGRVMRGLAGYRVTRYDRRGYGRSLDVGVPARFDDQVADLVEVIGDQPALVFGHSYGGTIALATAQRHPELVSGVIAYESPMPWMPWWPTDSAGSSAVRHAGTPADAAEAFMSRMIGQERWMRLPPSTRRARRAEGPTLVAELAHLRVPHAPAIDLAAIVCPVVGARGTRGAEHHHRSAEAIATGVEDGRLVVVEGATHGVHLTHAAAVVAMIDQLADRDSPG